MHRIQQDVRYAYRSLRQSPGFSIVAILTLALGIGANTAVFSVLNSVILAPLPYDQPEQIVRVYNAWEQAPEARGVMSGLDFLDYREGVDAFQDLAVLYTYRERGVDLTGTGAPQRVRALPVSSRYFEVYRATPLIGRTFTRDEERGDARVAVLSHHLWQSYAEGDEDIVGQLIQLDGTGYTVIAVMRPNFLDVVAGEVDVWIPQDLQPGGSNSRGNQYITVIGRLHADVSIEQAQAQADVIAATLQEQFPRTNEGRYARILPMHEDVVGRSDTMIFVLMGAAGLVLLIACVNVANLFLARSVARQKEFAIRSALGSGQGRLVRQLLTESVLLSAVGGLVGLVVTFVSVRVMLGMSPESLARANEVSFDPRLLGFAIGVTLLTGVAFGLAPAVRFTRLDLSLALRDATRGNTDGVRGRRVRGALVASQVSLALVLLVGAGLLMRSFVTLQQVDKGFAPANVATFEVHLPNARYGDPEQRIQFHQTFQDGMRALGGVDAVGATSWLPASGAYHEWGFRWQNADGERDGASIQVRIVEGDYFDAMDIGLLRGRTFQRSDGSDAPQVAILNESAARRAFPDESALGKQIVVGRQEPWTVIGVVRDAAITARGQFDNKVYLPHTQFGDDRNWALIQTVSTTTPRSDLFDLARRELAAIDGDLVIYHPRSMIDVMGRQVAQDRFALTLMGVFAAVALALAAIGIYGVLSYSVHQRTQEIGIRMALGARATQVRGIVVRQGVTLAAVGIGVGLLGALGLSRFIRSMMFEVTVTDPLVFGIVAAVLGVVALVAGYVPARRATRVDPMDALRQD